MKNKKQLRIHKNKVYIFNLITTFDKANGNSYKAFGECYYIYNGDRYYFSDMGLKGFKTNESFYDYGDAYDTVKCWLNNNHNTDIVWMSDYKNIVVFETEVTYKRFNQITN